MVSTNADQGSFRRTWALKGRPGSRRVQVGARVEHRRQPCPCSQEEVRPARPWGAAGSRWRGQAAGLGRRWGLGTVPDRGRGRALKEGPSHASKSPGHGSKGLGFPVRC